MALPGVEESGVVILLQSISGHGLLPEAFILLLAQFEHIPMAGNKSNRCVKYVLLSERRIYGVEGI